MKYGIQQIEYNYAFIYYNCSGECRRTPARYQSLFESAESIMDRNVVKIRKVYLVDNSFVDKNYDEVFYNNNNIPERHDGYDYTKNTQ